MSIDETISEYLHADDESKRTDDIARYIGGVMSDIERASFSKHLETCAVCAEAVEIIEQDADEWNDLLEGHDANESEVAAVARMGSTAQVMAVAVTAPAQPIVGGGWIPWAGALALAAAAVLAIFVFANPAPSPSPGLVAKGDFTLAIAIVRDGQTRRVRSGEPLQEGDQVGFFYTAPKAGHVALFHIGERGTVTPVLPESGDTPRAVAAADDAPLPAGGAVSAGQSCEWFVGIFGSERFSVTELRSAVEKAALRDDACERPSVDVSGISVVLHEVRR